MYVVFPLCIFKPTFRLSEFRLFKCFSICFVVSLKRATSSANLKLVRFSPSTLTPSEMSAFLKTSSITAVNSLGESGSPCLTPLCIGNSSDTALSKWILAVSWLYMFCKMFMYVSFVLVFLSASKMAKCLTVSKASRSQCSLCIMVSCIHLTFLLFGLEFADGLL